MFEITMEPGLATDGRCARVPWMDILKNVRGFIDPEYLPDYETLDADPSHLSMAKVKKLLRYWINRQKSEEATFQFHYVLQGSEKVLGKDPKTIIGKVLSKKVPKSSLLGQDPKTIPGKALSKKVPKSRGKPKKNQVTFDPTVDESEPVMGLWATRRKTSGKRLQKATACSRDIISDSGEEFDFAGVDEVGSSDDAANPLPEASGSSTAVHATDTIPVLHLTGTTEGQTPDWRRAPANLSALEIDLWNTFIEKLPESCSNWSQNQAIIQFQVFKGWSVNYPVPRKINSPNTPRQIGDIPEIGSHSPKQVHSPDPPPMMRDFPNVGKADTSIPKVTPGILNGKTEDVVSPTAGSGNPNDKSKDVPTVLETNNHTKDQNTDDNFGRVSQRGREVGMLDLEPGTFKTLARETHDVIRTAEDPELEETPDVPRKAGNKKEQPRTSKGKFTKSINQSEEQDTGKKRLREDSGESSADRDVAADKLPSPKKCKVDETSPKQQRRGRSKNSEPGPSVALTRSKAKIRNTRR